MSRVTRGLQSISAKFDTKDWIKHYYFLGKWVLIQFSGSSGPMLVLMNGDSTLKVWKLIHQLNALWSKVKKIPELSGDIKLILTLLHLFL